MVYKRSNIKVLLGPETLKHTVNGTTVNGEEEFPSKIGIRKPVGNSRNAFDKIGDTNIYKRTRPVKVFQGKPSNLERYPSNLELSGKKVETDEEKQKSQQAEETVNDATNSSGPTTNTPEKSEETPKTRDTSASSKMKDKQSAGEDRSQSRQKSKQVARSSANIVFSRNVLTEFGFSPQRTDTFSGHQRRRGQSADVERQFEEQAERHIRACQTIGNVKWSSKANQGCQGLKNTVSPLQSPMSFCSGDRLNNNHSFLRDKSFYRSETDLDRSGVANYLSQVRKHAGRTRSISKAYQKHHQLPEITGRTLIVGTGISIS